VTKGGPAVRPVALPELRATYRCGVCSYGITAAKLPHRCPMCGGRRWVPAR
jgi:rubrerythrin